MKKYLMVLVLFLTWQPVHAQCPFANLSLPDLVESRQLEKSQETVHVFPSSLFHSFRSSLGSFDAKKCAEVGMETLTLRDPQTGAIYTAYYTHHDECDGGNSYGVIVQGQAPTAAKAVALLQDSFISCL